MEEATDFRNHNLPLARIKKIMKSDEEVRVRAHISLLRACARAVGGWHRLG
jgi:nuclear transcription factor Y gamma